MNRIVTFEVWGEQFSPSKIDFRFHSQNEPGEIEDSGRFSGQTMDYGSASYAVPNTVDQSQIFRFLSDTFEPLLPKLVEAGATKWYINIERIYFAQCNEELDHEDLKNITRLKCSLSYSAYSVDTPRKEEEGFSIERYYNDSKKSPTGTQEGRRSR